MGERKKNYFKVQDIEGQGHSNESIIVEKMDKVMKQKFMFLIEVYMNHAFENGYNSSLAFRIITLYLYCDFKKNDDDSFSFNLIEEVQRFLDHELTNGGIESIRKCMDLLLIKRVRQKIADKYLKYWKIKVLAVLKKYYANNHMKKQKKKASLSLRQMCKQQLKKEGVRHQTQMYSKILDILIEEQRIILNSKKSNGKALQAIQNANNIIRILERAEQIIIPKYQQQLMLAYWENAKLHFELHYQTYAKKYSETALNIAERINDKKIVIQARSMLQKHFKQ